MEARKRIFESHSKMLGQQAEAEVIQLYLKQEETNQRNLHKVVEEHKVR